LPKARHATNVTQSRDHKEAGETDTMRSPRPPFKEKTFSATRELQELERFFMAKDKVHQTLRRVVKNLSKAKIDYAVLGGMALSAYRYRRATTDVDVLLTADGLEVFRERFLDKDYDQAPRRPRRFVDRKSGVTIDMLVAGRFPGSGKPGPVAFPEPVAVAQEMEGIRYVNLPTLIELKLAARRWRDFSDVVELIRFNELDEAFLPKLHASTHSDFIECLEEKRREDEYEAQG
jgi:hypothetical protein